MKEPGLDDRHRNKDGRIREKNGTTKNENLDKPIPGFAPSATLTRMKKVTGADSENGVRRAVAKKNRG
jgi:hypothetical protein